MAYLLVMSQGKELCRRELGGNVLLGRAIECDICIADARLSRKHCRVEAGDAGEWFVLDLGSRNGTTLRGDTVFRQQLHDGDEFVIGRTTVRFVDSMLLPPRPSSPVGAAALPAVQASAAASGQGTQGVLTAVPKVLIASRASEQTLRRRRPPAPADLPAPAPMPARSAVTPSTPHDTQLNAGSPLVEESATQTEADGGEIPLPFVRPAARPILGSAPAVTADAVPMAVASSPPVAQRRWLLPLLVSLILAFGGLGIWLVSLML